jgi:hypothetical protein
MNTTVETKQSLLQGNNANDIVHCKLQYGDEFRRFLIPKKSSSISDLKDKIRTILTLETDFTVKYKDEENEWITISSDLELETGLMLIESLFRITVCPINSPLPAHANVSSTPPAATSDEDLGSKKWKRKDFHSYGKKDWKENKGEKPWKDNKREKKPWRENKRERKNWREDKGGKNQPRRKFKNENEASNSYSSEEVFSTLTVDEIEVELESLKGEISILIEKKQGIGAVIAEKRNQIRTLRQDPNASKEAIVSANQEIRDKKGEMNEIKCQIREARQRIKTLKDVAISKKVKDELFL